MSCRHMILGVDERKQRKAKQKKAKAKKGKKKKKDDTDEDEEDEDEDETDPDEEEERAALYKRRMPPAHPSVEVCLSLVSACHVMLVHWSNGVTLFWITVELKFICLILSAAVTEFGCVSGNL